MHPKFIAYVYRVREIMASETLQRLTVIIFLLASNAISIILSICPQDQAQVHDILCTVNRNALLPSPAIALVHCETNQRGGLLVYPEHASAAPTNWVVNDRACFFRQGESCTHLFMRIDSQPTTEGQIGVCRFPYPDFLCTCVKLTGKSFAKI